MALSSQLLSLLSPPPLLGPGDRYIILLYSIRGMACVSYHGMMISLPEIFVAKRLIFIEKNVKNAIKTISGGLLYENLVVQSY